MEVLEPNWEPKPAIGGTGHRCTATSKTTGERCRNAAVTGYTVCRMHGAGSPTHGRPGGRPITHGRYSKRLPDRLAARYRESQRDPRLLELRDEINLLDARLGELLDHLPTGESGLRWRQVQMAFDNMTAVIAGGDAELFRLALDRLSRAVRGGDHEYQVWQEICQVIEQRKRLVESERKRLVDMQQMITAEHAFGLMTSIAAIIREYVRDGATLAAISTKLRALATIEPG